MARFIQETQGQADVGIGNQQVFNEDLSYMRSYAAAADSLIGAADNLHTGIAIGKANDAVESGLAEADQYLKEAEAAGTVAAEATGRKTDRLNKAVARGRIPQEHAKLLASYEVVKSIEENPLFADKIRQRSSAMLGFDPQSESIRSFFRSIAITPEQPELTKHQKKQQEYTEIFGEAGADIATQEAILEIENNMALQRASLNEVELEKYLGDRATQDDVGTFFDIYHNAVQVMSEGGEIDSAMWGTLINQDMMGFLDATEAGLEEHGLHVTGDQWSKFRADTSTRYKELQSMFEKIDTDFLNERELERMVTMSKLYGRKAFPQMMTIMDNFGGQVTSRLIDFAISVGNDPDRKRALERVNPALRPFLTLLEQSPERFQERITNTVSKLGNPNARLTEEDADVIDLVIPEIMPTLDPENQESLITSLAASGAQIKSASAAMSTQVATATPTTKKITKQTWEQIKTTVPNKINQLINETPQTLTSRGDAYMVINSAGTLSLYQGKNVDGSPKQAVNHPAWGEIQKINMFLNSRNGWETELGIDKNAMAMEMLSKAHPPSYNRIVAKEETKVLQQLMDNLTEERQEQLRQEALRRKQAGGK